MILASVIGIFVIPPLYVLFQAIRERLRPGARPSLAPASLQPSPPLCPQETEARGQQSVAAE
jgi:multidrug efflux pump